MLKKKVGRPKKSEKRITTAKKEIKVLKAVVEEKMTPPKKVGNIISVVGRRKTSVARVRLAKTGEGKIIINGKDYKVYFPYFEYQDIVVAPLKATGKDKDFDFSIKIAGGGVRSQAEAVRHGISRALVEFNEEFKKTLRAMGYMTRDPRMKERKKPGLKRARRAPQWQKR